MFLYYTADCMTESTTTTCVGRPALGKMALNGNMKVTNERRTPMGFTWASLCNLFLIVIIYI